MRWFKRTKEKQIENKDELVSLLVEYIHEARNKDWNDKWILEKFEEKKYPKDLVKTAFIVANVKVKGGKMAKKVEEDDFDEEEEEVEEEEEETPAPKKKVVVAKKVLSVGTIRPVYQQVGYEVLKKIDGENELWIPTQSLDLAETLSYIFKQE